MLLLLRRQAAKTPRRSRPHPRPAAAPSRTLRAGNSPFRGTTAASRLSAALQRSQPQKKDPMASYDFDGYQGATYTAVFEGTVFEGVVTNHVDGGFSGPIIVMLTTDYYSHDHQQLLLPQGNPSYRQCPECRKRTAAQAFCRFQSGYLPRRILPRLEQVHRPRPARDNRPRLQMSITTYSVRLQQPPRSAGWVALRRSATTEAFLPPTRKSAMESPRKTSQEGRADMNHFINRLPVITVKEGSRARVYINQDILIPSYAEHRVDSAL